MNRPSHIEKHFKKINYTYKYNIDFMIEAIRCFELIQSDRVFKFFEKKNQRLLLIIEYSLRKW